VPATGFVELGICWVGADLAPEAPIVLPDAAPAFVFTPVLFPGMFLVLPAPTPVPAAPPAFVFLLPPWLLTEARHCEYF